MTNQRIAFVIPAYNASSTIAAAVRSAREQVVPADEIIVVDDGSVDDTHGVAERAGATVIRRENGGPGAARNAGIRATSAEWIALLDADDLARPARTHVQRSQIDDPEVAVVHSARGVPALHAVDPPPGNLDFETLWRRNRISTSTVLLRRSAWEAVGGFDESRSLIGVEDYNLWLRLAHAGWKFSWLGQVLVDYLPDELSLSMQSERMAYAELSNVTRIGSLLQLPAELIRIKEARLYQEYAIELFHRGHRRTARDFFREAARRGPIGWRSRLRLLAATLSLPPLKRAAAAGD